MSMFIILSGYALFKYSNYFIIFGIAIAAVIILYCFACQIYKCKYISEILSFFGKYSLEIYLCQCICLNIGVGTGYVRILTIFLSATFLSSLLAILINKTKYFRFILFGYYIK